MEENNSIQAVMQLRITQIEELSIKNNFLFLDLFNGEDRQCNFELIPQFIQIDCEQDPEYDIAEERLTVLASVDKDDSKLEIRIIIRGFFWLTKNLTKEKALDLVEISGSASLYSIARSIITGATAQAYSGSPVILPMVNMVSTIDAIRKKKQEQEQ